MFKRRTRRAEAQLQMGADRRRATRQTAGWASRYVVANESTHIWYLAGAEYAPCVLQDLSLTGAGLELSSRDDVSVGDRVVLDLQLGERQRASIKVTGEVRHAKPVEAGTVVAGIEFTEVGDLERALLHRLLRDLGTKKRQPA